MEKPLNNEHFMQQALELAKEAAKVDEVPIGAVVVYKNKVIATGYNQSITTNDPTAHAEIVCLRNAAKALGNYRLKDVSLYVTLEPCCMCYGAMIHARITKLIYGASETKKNPTTGPKLLAQQPFNHKIEIEKGVLEEQCSEILLNFFHNRR